MPTISCDYFFLGGNDESTSPCLAKSPHRSRAKTARVVPAKGGLEAVAKVDARDIHTLGTR
eukprot:11525132-Prorocentrum_lima.AAC.1